jgi:hypothetical protein
MTTVIEFPNDEVWITGSHLLRRFQDSLFKCLTEQLEPKYGKDWFEKTLVPTPNSSFPVDKDLTGFLSQLLRYENQNFRLAIAQGFFQESFLTKEQEEAFKSIKRLRDRWFHESSEVKSKIKISDLEKLALAIQVFQMETSLKMETERILSGAKEGNVTQALFSLPWIARHLEQQSIQTNSYKMLQNEIAIWKKDYTNLTNTSDEFQRLNEFTKMLEHAYQALDFQYLYLMHFYHLIQKNLLDMLDEGAHEGLDEDLVSLLEESKKYQFVSPIAFLTWEESELEAIKSSYNRLTETQGSDKCDCVYCAQFSGVMSPFTVEDNKRNDFFDKIMGWKNGARIARLFLSKK